MGNYTSIDDMMTDPKLRETIQDAVQMVYDMQEEYHEESRFVESVEVDQKQFMTNILDTTMSAGYVVADGKSTIKQTVNAESIMQTSYYGRTLASRMNNNPMIQYVALDLLNETHEDSFDKNYPNFFDPMYVLDLLSIMADEAEFDFDLQAIKYIRTADPQAAEEIKTEGPAFEAYNEARKNSGGPWYKTEEVNAEFIAKLEKAVDDQYLKVQAESRDAVDRVNEIERLKNDRTSRYLDESTKISTKYGNLPPKEQDPTWLNGQLNGLRIDYDNDIKKLNDQMNEYMAAVSQSETSQTWHAMSEELGDARMRWKKIQTLDALTTKEPQYITFEEIFSRITSNYKMEAEYKVKNFYSSIKNIQRNIRLAQEAVGANVIKVVGSTILQNSTIEQQMDLTQIMVINIEEGGDELISNLQPSKTTPKSEDKQDEVPQTTEETSQETSQPQESTPQIIEAPENKVNKYVLYIVVGIVAVFIFTMVYYMSMSAVPKIDPTRRRKTIKKPIKNQ